MGDTDATPAPSLRGLVTAAVLLLLVSVGYAVAGDATSAYPHMAVRTTQFFLGLYLCMSAADYVHRSAAAPGASRLMLFLERVRQAIANEPARRP